MNDVKVRAIVLKENISGESDKIITLFAKDVGKISVYCRGARNTKSKFLASAVLFCYADFMLGSTKNGYVLKGADVIENFYRLRDDLSRFSYASYFAELADKLTNENNPSNNIMHLLIIALQQLVRGRISHSFIARLYELKIVQLSGFMPYMSRFCECGSLEIQYISKDGLLCQRCAKTKPSIKISDEMIYMLIYIFETDTKNLFSFAVNDELEKIFEDIAQLLLYENFGFELSSYKFIKDNFL